MTVWGSCTKAQRYRVQKVINHCARIVTGTRKTEHVSPVLSQLEWFKLDELLVERDMAAMHRILYAANAPVSLRARVLYRSTVSTRTTRGSDDQLLELPKVRTELGRQNFAFRAVRTWNRAPVDVRKSATLKTCTQRVRRLLRAGNVLLV